MKAASPYNTKTCNLSSSLPINRIKHSQQICENVHYKLMLPTSLKLGPCGCKLGVGCVAVSSGSVAELEKELEAEINPEEEEWMQVGRLREKCKERRGVAELLECLETEAIMGEDEGREATDYNRRAQIFDKSSRVFQALKELNTPAHQS